jgi:hypothetical protein
MRDTMTVAAWVGGAMLLSVSLLVLCQHAEGERTRAALQATRAHVDARIRTLDARLTDLQAEASRRKLASVMNPPLDPKRLVKAAKELDQLIGNPPPEAATAPAPKPVAPRAAAAAPAPAPHPASVALVRVCAGGKFYHRPGCKRPQKPTMAIPRSQAEQRGWKACPTCKP